LKPKSICVIVHGLNKQNRLLQPWRYVLEVASQLSLLGHQVTLLKEGDLSTDLPITGNFQEVKLHSVRNFLWKENNELIKKISTIDPNIIIWSVGLTSFLHQRYPKLPGKIQAGIFSSPIYSLKDLNRIGFSKLITNYHLSGSHIMGALSPNWLLRTQANRSDLKYLVTQTDTTNKAISKKFWRKPVITISPAVDDLWMTAEEHWLDIRREFNYLEYDFVIVYFGSPAPLRGLPQLIRAVAIARETCPEIKLTILNRRNESELAKETEDIQSLIKKLALDNYVNMYQGFLDQRTLIRIISASNIVALPFEIIPSDAPLSVLEARTLGKPIITTQLGCLPELAGKEHVYFAEPGDTVSLSRILLQANNQLREKIINPKSNSGFQKFRTWSQVGEEWSDFIESL
jgi:glycosyltransferase involved in cell wall biosynthesis